MERSRRERWSSRSFEHLGVTWSVLNDFHKQDEASLSEA
jgi:hypothetical protein